MTAEAVRARRAVAALFVLNGAVLASWVPHIPTVKRAHGLGDAQLGGLLLCIAACMLIAWLAPAALLRST